MINRPKTIICDIDGVIFRHGGDITKQHMFSSPTILPGALEKIKQWDIEGSCIILVTGRRESTRSHTKKQLAEAGIIYDHLIMGVTGGVRLLINDRKDNSKEDTAIAINLKRNEGFTDE